MTILTFGTVMLVYVFWRAIYPMQSSWNVKGPLTCLLILAAYKYKILQWLGGPMTFAPDLPWWVLIPGAWLFSVAFILFILLLVTNILQWLWELVRLCLRRGKWENKRVFLNRLNLGLACFSMILGSIGVFFGTDSPVIKEITIESDRIPERADGLKIALMADIHVDHLTNSTRVKEMVELANTTHADVILIAGDFVDGRVAVFGKDLLPLKELKAEHGVFGIPGNHEYYSGYREWMQFLPTLGIRMLENEHALIADGALAIVGVTDPAAGFGRGGELPDMAKALNGAPSVAYRILMAHQPRLAAKAAARGVDLQLSGHTHGGMIPGFASVVALFNDGYVSGLYQVGDMALYVSNGTGIWNGFPIRICTPAEITLITLKSHSGLKSRD